MNKALIIVDVQKDFLPGGALPAEDGNKIIPVINEMMDDFDLVIASKDWHPEDTVHFEKWPKHCVKNTEGAEFGDDLNTDKIHGVFLKGTGNKDDGYSAFEATNESLKTYLKNKGIEEFYISGLVTEYCVKNTAIDSAHFGFDTYLVQDAQTAVKQDEEELEKSIKEMKEAGVQFVKTEELDFVSA